ncbi:MAG TPA: protein kinase [Elusimicrobiota bacterium]|nr:protein kinase [Elusimicrobiota bacterium]
MAAGTAFASGAVAKSTSTAAKPRASVAKSSAAAAGATVALSTGAARAAAYARTAQTEFGRHEYWSAWRDAGNALSLGSKDPAVSALRNHAYVRAMAEEKLAVSSAAVKAALRPRPALPGKKPAPEQIPSAPKAPATSKRSAWRRAAATVILGLILLTFLIVLISRPAAPAKPRRDPGKGHVSASEVPRPAPLPKAGTVLGGRFILGSIRDEADGVCVYDGRDLSDESMTIVRYPNVPGGLERARKAVDFKHPSVAQLRGAFSQGVCIFAAYEPLRGDSLRKTLERLPERRYSPEQALRLMKHLCEALDAAHALGLCHGPLAPGEIIIGPSQVKVRGFGLWPVAALAYAAPEFSPENGESTPSSDLFSLAACLYEMLTGKTAFFESRDPKGTALFVPPSQKVPELGPAMDEFFAKALAPEPDQRFASAAELFASFSRLVVSKAAPGKDGKKA